jgi:hypothetical protein
MKKVKYLKAKDVADFKSDKEGNIIIPERFVIYIKKTPEELWQERIADLEKELLQMDEPTDKELIELAKQYHPYYILELELESFRSKLL